MSDLIRIDIPYFNDYAHWEGDCFVWHSSYTKSNDSSQKTGKIVRIEDGQRIHYKAHRALFCLTYPEFDYDDESWWCRKQCSTELCINPDHHFALVDSDS